MHQKIRGKVEISSAPYNAEGEWKCAPYYIKGEEIISDFELRKSKILSVRFGTFNNSHDKESSVVRRVEQIGQTKRFGLLVRSRT